MKEFKIGDRARISNIHYLGKVHLRDVESDVIYVCKQDGRVELSCDKGYFWSPDDLVKFISIKSKAMQKRLGLWRKPEHDYLEEMCECILELLEKEAK